MTRPIAASLLIVEDDPDFRATLSDWLECSGYAVFAAADGVEALALAQDRAPDVVITDLKMPKMDGLELMHRLQAIVPQVPVIFLSGQATIRDAVAALRDGLGFDFLEKPLADFEVLNQVVERALNRGGVASRAPRPEDVTETGSEPSDDSLGDRVLAFIEANYSEPLSLQVVADALGYSPAYLTNLIRKLTGKTIQQWIRDVRMRHARDLMIRTEAPIKQIAMMVGYSDPNYFVRHFRKLYDVPPTTWRQMNAARPT